MHKYRSVLKSQYNFSTQIYSFPKQNFPMRTFQNNKRLVIVIFNDLVPLGVSTDVSTERVIMMIIRKQCIMNKIWMYVHISNKKNMFSCIYRIPCETLVSFSLRRVNERSDGMILRFRFPFLCMC